MTTMLLDRKKINRIARWFAIILAVIFALGTVFLGVGSGTGNIFAGCAGGGSGGISPSSSLEDREKFYLEQVQQNPQDSDSMLALANFYSGSEVGRFDEAIEYYNQYLALKPNDPDALMLRGRAQMNKGDFGGAVGSFNQVTLIRPTDSFAYLQLGLAGKNAGQNQTAILAWTKWLEMNPNDSNAPAIREQITQLSALPAVTPQTSTVPAATGFDTPAPSPAPAP